MALTSTKVFILEVMGRHAGWIAAAGGLAAEHAEDAPQIILFPEIAFDEERFLARVKDSVERNGYCAVVVSEGVRNAEGKFLSDAGVRDAFGHAQLGGVAPVIAEPGQGHASATSTTGPSRTTCSAPRATSPPQVDVEQAYAVGEAAVRAGAGGQERRDARDQASVRRSLPLGDRRGGARRRGQRGEEDAAGLHHRGRLRHHRGLPALPGAAHRGRGLSALRERPAGLRAPEERRRWRRSLPRRSS